MKSALEQQAAFYRGYATDDRDLAPLTIVWRRSSLPGFWSM